MPHVQYQHVLVVSLTLLWTLFCMSVIQGLKQFLIVPHLRSCAL